MTDTPPTDPAAEPAAAQIAPVVYQAGGIRKTFFAFVFLILLPFWVSLPVMLYQRLAKGLVADAWGLGVMGLAFTLLMVLVTFELLHSLRARIEIGSGGFRYTLPRRGLFPMLGYRSAEVAYSDIDVVETRREVYGGALAPVMLRGVRVVTKDGKNHSLGYVSEADVDPLFPVAEIGLQIAGKAGRPFNDTGSVFRQVRQKLMGRRSERVAEPVTEEMVAGLNRKHNRFMLGLVTGMAMLLLAGLSYDFQTGTIDRGERARDTVQRSAPAVKTPAPAR